MVAAGLPTHIQNVHPYLLHSGHLLIPTYGVLAALGLMAALNLSLRTARLAGLPPDQLWNTALFTLLAAFLLSRLLLIAANLHAFLAYPILLLRLPSLTSTGILLTLAAALLYLRRNRLPLLPTLDAFAPCATLLWSFLALGHFAEGSDTGLPTSHPWGLRIPPDTTRLHPVPLYAALVAALLTVILLSQLRRNPPPGHTLASALAATGLTQFLLTFFRQPYPYLNPASHLLDPIQYLALGMIVLAGLLLLRPRKPV